MVCKTIRIQRTFREFESEAIAWIRSLHDAFSIKRLTMVRKPLDDYSSYFYKWTVIAVVENL